jgi:membrane protease YdiL (CAAX protease family)
MRQGRGGKGRRLAGTLEVAALAAWAAVIVLCFNLAVFTFFLMPPAPGALWVAGLGLLYLWWHTRTTPSGRPRRLAVRMRLRRPEAPAGWLLGAAASTVVLMLGAVTFMEMATGPLDLADSPFHQDILAYTETVPGWLVFTFAAAVVVPMVEELAFRGRLQGELERRWGPGRGRAWAVFFAAGVFALVHMGGPHPALLVVPFVVGVACGVAVILTRSVWTAVLIHGSWNGVIALLAGPAAGPAEAAGEARTGGVVAVSLAMVAVGAAGWWRLLGRRGREPRPRRP